MQAQMDQMMAQMAQLMNNQMPMMQPPQMGGMGGMGGQQRQQRAPLVREEVADSASTGVVIQWKGRFGWIKATSDISGFPDSERRGGRIYLHSKDINGADELPVGAEVSFQLYKDKG